MRKTRELPVLAGSGAALRHERQVLTVGIRVERARVSEVIVSQPDITVVLWSEVPALAAGVAGNGHERRMSAIIVIVERVTGPEQDIADSVASTLGREFPILAPAVRGFRHDGEEFSA